MEALEYKQIENSPVIFGNTHINLNDNEFYYTVWNNYNRLQNAKLTKVVDDIPKQSNMYMIQHIFLDLAHTTKPLLIGGVEIDFAKDKWDFSSEYKSGKMVADYIYTFDLGKDATDYQVIVLKLFVMYCILEYGIHNGSNSNRFKEIRSLMKYMQKINKNYIEDLTLQDYKNYFSERSMIYTTMVKYRRDIETFLKFYSIIAKNVYTIELKKWFADIDVLAVKAHMENNKTKLLPTNFYILYTAKLYEMVFDNKQEKWNRGYAGLLYIGTQTGLRSSEIAILRPQDLEVMSYKGKTIGILRYRSTKSGNGKNRVYDEGQTNANKKVIEVYECLYKIFEKDRKNLKVDFLVPRNYEKKSAPRDYKIRKNVSSVDLLNFNKLFCLKNAKEFDLINSNNAEDFEGNLVYESKVLSFATKSDCIKAGLKVGDVFSYPITRQFRVYVASELRERGVDDRTTAFLLNHHCIEMYGYYARPKHSIQEDIDFSQEIVKDVVRDKTRILGPKGEALTAKIDGIIEKNNFNVEKDLDAIVEKVCDEMPIRAKAGGFCVKSNPRRECRHDAKTDEFMCAYGCCPNHCHMYFMLPISYEKIKTLKNTYEYNLNAGYENAAQKEAYKLLSAIDKEFMPELLETRVELSKKGRDEIIKAHAEMASIIDILDKIEAEVILWKNQIQKK